jgi:DNA-binding response OmpR family regulator
VAKLRQTILVVDDDQNARSLLGDIIRSEGFEVVEAENGLPALECLKQSPVNMIITDRDMPQMDGMEFLKRLREDYPTIPVLMLSGYGEESMWGKAIGLGARDYLLKPFKVKEVIAQIRKYLTEK